MSKKNDKRLCWNCDGSVSLHLTQCPYCGVDLTRDSGEKGEKASFSSFASPFQSAPTAVDASIPKPPFSNISAVSEDEWNHALGEEGEAVESEEEVGFSTTRREMIALLLLLPGVVFFLFGLALFLFSSDGVLTLKWSQSFAYYYFIGAIPLLFLGWRALR